MDYQVELKDFSGICRLFPLPNVVLFPHVILPLHIFEPRYRQMTQDALDGDQCVTIVQACPLDQANPWTEPVPIHDVACLGKIIQSERLPDGRFNMLLLGCQRVRLIRELPSPRLYRLAEASLIEDVSAIESGGARRADLIALFLEVFRRRHGLPADLTRLVHSDLPLGVLSDIVAHALDLSGAVKQSLLEEHRIDDRVLRLTTILREILGQTPPGRPFSHPFSLN